MRDDRLPHKRAGREGDRGDASSRVAVALALGVALLVAVYAAWAVMTGHTH